MSGLYVTYYLLHKYGATVSVDLYEAADRVGGRIHTIHDREGVYEAGAGRICIPNHKRVLALLKHFGIRTRAIPPEPAAQRVHRERLCHTRSVHTDVPTHHLADVVPFDTHDIQIALGYDAEFETGHARGAFESLCSGCQYAIVDGGFQTLCERMLDEILRMGGVVRLRTPVKELHREGAGVSVVCSEGHMRTYDSVFSCIPPDAMLTIDYTNAFPSAWISPAYVKKVPLLRIYARFDNKWWGDSRVTMDTPIRYFIPIGNSTIAMVSYTDGDLAREWHIRHRRDPRCAERKLVQLLRNAFGKDVPDPTWVRFYYWDTGVHLTPPLSERQMGAKKWSARVSQPNTDVPLFLANEAYSSGYQQWVEGALQSAEQAIRRMRYACRLRHV